MTIYNSLWREYCITAVHCILVCVWVHLSISCKLGKNGTGASPNTLDIESKQELVDAWRFLRYVFMHSTRCKGIKHILFIKKNSIKGNFYYYFEFGDLIWLIIIVHNGSQTPRYRNKQTSHVEGWKYFNGPNKIAHGLTFSHTVQYHINKTVSASSSNAVTKK